MGRMSLAQEYLDEVPEQEGGAEGTWLVLYDFKGVKPNPRFWSNVKRLSALVGDSRLVQYSVFMTGSRRAMMAAVKLTRHYGGEVMVFNGEEVELSV